MKVRDVRELVRQINLCRGDQPFASEEGGHLSLYKIYQFCVGKRLQAFVNLSNWARKISERYCANECGTLGLFSVIATVAV